MNDRRVQIGLGLGVASLILLILILVRALYGWIPISYPAVVSTTTVATKSSAESHSGLIPDHLLIPSLGIDALVEKVGVNGKGNIGNPSTFHTVAWYRGSPQPGMPGISIIDGHLNNGLGLDGVFANLARLQPGAEVVVKDAAGQSMKFVVVGSSSLAYDRTLDDLDKLTGNSKPTLALITCEGAWVPSQKTYDQRIVILARLVD